MLLHDLRLRAPAPLSLRGLVDLTRLVAVEVRAGRHPEQRWYHRLHSGDHLDVWLIGWATEPATELHDHAGSLGALTVVSGERLEHRWSPIARRPLLRRLPSGRAAGFRPGHVHDVTNRTAAPAVSVHAYSPPLTAMSYYAVDPPGRRRRPRTVLTEPQEAPG